MFALLMDPAVFGVSGDIVGVFLGRHRRASSHALCILGELLKDGKAQGEKSYKKDVKPMQEKAWCW